MGVSAAMIVKDEIRCVERCISSVISAVDEFVIVDTGSTDGTLQVIERMQEQNEKIKLYRFEWINDFSAARNYSLSKVTNGWVFVVDADDVLPEDQSYKVREITSILDKEGKQTALYVVMDNVINGHIVSSYDNTCLRIFPSHLRYRDQIHERVELPKDFPVARYDLHILHDGYDPNLTDRKKKIIRNLQLLQLSLKSDQKNARLWLQLGREMTAFDKDKAKKYFDIAESLSNDPNILNWIKRSREEMNE
ncbi:glycosyltransferase family 2 protein [Cohnella sp. AR92]|uniref:glycosyltransferase family 2 protein n=1 Tax=Cohnella sp. AR92 TaxID=648716 RepID=UPI000F8F2CB3|nr:glycosyltransferase family 2 protein [Cohnella sp. AR92]RUS43058.1 glycosyltransferase family 2 protein [Cohnella sp. AR92]